MKTLLLKGGSVVTPQQVVRTDILVRDGRVSLSAHQQQPDEVEVIDIAGKYVVPGFVDIHFHGYELFDFVCGLYDPDTDTSDTSQATYDHCLDRLTSRLTEFGVTGFYLASYAAPTEDLSRCCSRLAHYLRNAADASGGARLWGGFLEGTFISPKMAGAQNPEMFMEPCPESFDRIEDNQVLKLVNVVPDFGAPSCRLTEYLTNRHIVVGMGHTDASAEQVANAVRSGLKYCIHFTNGPTGGSYKPFSGGGAIEAVLTIDDLYAELICDGYHVAPAYVRDIVERKGIDRILGVTDCSYIAGSDLKEFTSGGVRGRVGGSGKYLRVVEKANTLFGSNLTMNAGFANMLNWLTSDMQGVWYRAHRPMDLAEALVATAKMFASNPCSIMGLDEHGYGSIADGSIADLCVLNVDGAPGTYELVIDSTVVAGSIAYSAGQTTRS